MSRAVASRAISLLTLSLLVVLISALSHASFGQVDAEVTDEKVGAELDRAADEEIATRLRATYEALPELRSVVVTVQAGVVSLSGVADSSRSRELAGKLAAQVAGVAAVENAIGETRSVSRRLGIALSRLEVRAWELIESVPLLLLALMVLAGAVLIARILASWTGLFRWLTENAFLRDLARQVLRLTIIAVGVLLALEILDATALVGAVLGAAGIVGLAVGFAFRDLVENYIASILLSLRQPFAPNDLVRIADHEGRVARLTSRATILVTPDGNHVRIPNGIVFKSMIENLTRKPERRFSISVGVGVEEDLVAAQDLGVDTLSQMLWVLDEPRPSSQVDALGDSSVLLTFHGWVDQRGADFIKVKSEATRLVKQAFDERGIEMPEPIHRLRIEKVSKVKPVTTQTATSDARDTSRDTHLDELVRDERSTEEDLLEENGNQE